MRRETFKKHIILIYVFTLSMLTASANGITVISATTSGPTFEEVLVVFDEPYDPNTGLDPFNYSVFGPDLHFATSVSFLDPSSVILTLDDPLIDISDPHTLEAFSISSAAAPFTKFSSTVGISSNIPDDNAVPEPVTATLLLAGTLAMTRRRRVA